MRMQWPRLVRPGSRVFIGGGASVPFALVDSMLEQADAFKDVELVHIHGLGETPWIDPQVRPGAADQFVFSNTRAAGGGGARAGGLHAVPDVGGGLACSKTGRCRWMWR